MTGATIPNNMLALARDAVRRNDLSPQELDEALTVLSHSPEAADRLIAREVPRAFGNPRADMCTLHPEDPPARLSPGGASGWLYIAAMAFLAVVLITLAGALAMAPRTTLSFITLGVGQNGDPK